MEKGWYISDHVWLAFGNCFGGFKFLVRLSEACSIGTGAAGLFGRAIFVRPCKRTSWGQFYLTRNPLFGLVRVARPNRPAAPVQMLRASGQLWLFNGQVEDSTGGDFCSPNYLCRAWATTIPPDHTRQKTGFCARSKCRTLV